jgi:serine/threonine protein kinase
MIVNSKNGLESKENFIVKIENQLNLSHSCILSLIGFIFGPDLTISGKLKIVEMYLEDSSLAEVISENPIWWTATAKAKGKAKAKAIAGIVLGPRFAHNLGFIHGHLNSKNIWFDLDHQIQIIDFCRISLEVCESERKRMIYQAKDGHQIWISVGLH